MCAQEMPRHEHPVGRLFERVGSATIGLRKTPRPLISTSHRSPGFMRVRPGMRSNPTASAGSPAGGCSAPGVPITITSPARSRIAGREVVDHLLDREQHVVERGVLLLDAVQPRDDACARRQPEFVGVISHGPNVPERSKFLPRPNCRLWPWNSRTEPSL